MNEPTRLEAVSVVYQSAGERVAAVTGVTLGFGAGMVTVMAGPSGSGKSTLLRLLAGFDKPTTGSVYVAGRQSSAISERARRRLRRHALSVVHQRPLANLLVDLTAEQHVVFARRLRGASASSTDVLDQFGLGGHRRSRPTHLSGGEQQRLALAMCLAGSAGVILADEPTAELDRANAGGVFSALRALADDGRTVIVATHDPDLIDAADVVAELHDGRLV
ncbi:MAG TPA: ATP-binding cassette domain-containing protein [Ilumatobacteraceae bacterium]|nr:ATP-binding cassette domain-containing protein [Ilumatobacteraceae bacterium]